MYVDKFTLHNQQYASQKQVGRNEQSTGPASNLLCTNTFDTVIAGMKNKQIVE